MSIRAENAAIGPLPQSSRRRSPWTYSTGWSVALLVSDVAAFVSSSYLAAVVGLVGFHHWASPVADKRILIAQAIYVCGWVLIFERLGLYRRSFALSMKDELYYTTTALALGTIPQLLIFTIVPAISTSRTMIALSLPFSIILVGLTRTIAHKMRSSAFGRRRRRTAVVGRVDRVAAAYSALQLGAPEDALILAVSNMDDSTQENVEQLPWFREAMGWGCDTLILTEVLSPALMLPFLQVAAQNQVQVAFAPPRMRRHSYRLMMRMEGQQVLIVPQPLPACTPRARLHKRITDVALATIALMVFSPVMIAAALAIYMESGAPVLFRQERVGRGGKVFNILKFRSMRKDAEKDSGPVWAALGDNRTTRVGAWLRRFSFDELPQFFNVLNGDMSLVGPRPERPMFVEKFRTSLSRYDERHLVKPGITGWSQVHMKRILQPSQAGEKLKYDLEYIESWSPFMDLSVLFQTFVEFLFHRAG